MEKSQFAAVVGAEIRRRRKEKAVSQESFADECGIHRTYMGAIERGEKVMSIEMARRIVSKLDTTLAEFFGGIGM